MIYDTIDVGLDGWYFYKLELSKDELPLYITRNTHVNDAILSFAVLGALKNAVKSVIITWRVIGYLNNWANRYVPKS